MANRSMFQPRVPDPRLTAARLRAWSKLQPTLGLVLGSGFHRAMDEMEVVAEAPYVRIPGFPPVSVGGHGGRLLIGRLAGTPVLVLSGRAHFYEGYSLEQVTFPIRVLAEFGIRALLLTNAAGGINRRFDAGEFMRLRDHINFMGSNPLRGIVPEGKRRFVDLTQTYDPGLNRLLQAAAKKCRIRLHVGVYLAVSGPSYETPAEVRAYARLGADAVGMSTVPEAIVARQCDLRVAALSCITNPASGRSKGELSHEGVLHEAEKVRTQAARLLCEFARCYGHYQ
jgi:purine-nucleoside phosphorylase